MEYLYIFILLLVAFGFVAVSLIGCVFLGAKRNPTSIKQEPFECGSTPFHDVQERPFAAHYYLVAILFILFDLETILLYVWATQARGMGGSVVLAGLIFICILVLGLVYVWKKGLLNWTSGETL